MVMRTETIDISTIASSDSRDRPVSLSFLSSLSVDFCTRFLHLYNDSGQRIISIGLVLSNSHQGQCSQSRAHCSRQNTRQTGRQAYSRLRHNAAEAHRQTLRPQQQPLCASWLNFLVGNKAPSSICSSDDT